MIYDFAARVVQSQVLADKLATPPRIVPRGQTPLRLTGPGRPPELTIVRSKVTVPPVVGMRDPQQRARILHAFANHELQAIELFAWALLAFADAPTKFQVGLLSILRDEQRHMQLYIGRLHALGYTFGQFPVTGHFWTKLEHMRTPLEFVCAMGLVFENANLDFASEYAAAAAAAGDHQTAAAMQTVHDEEIRHVRFAWHWFTQWTAPQPPWHAFEQALQFPLTAARARGPHFDRQARQAAGLTTDFIDALQAIDPRAPSGRAAYGRPRE